MGRRRRATARKVQPDPRFNSIVVSKFVSNLMWEGKKSVAQLQELYAAFLERLQELLRVRAVLAYPQDVDMRKLLRKTTLKTVDEFSHYVHGTLTRRIIVVEPGR